MTTAVNQELAAQSLISRLFQKGGIGAYFKQKKAAKHRRYYCGEMDAYNKQRAYRKHKRSRSRKLFAKRSPQRPEGEPVAQTKADKKLTSPPERIVTDKTQAKKPAPPANKAPEPTTPVPKSPPVAKKSPVVPDKPATTPPAEKKKPMFTRTELKKMTESERRDTLQQMEPEMEL